MRIGIFMIGSREWMGGVSYVENLVKAVRLLPMHEQPRLFLISGEANLAALEQHTRFLHLFDGFCYCGRRCNEVSQLVSVPCYPFSGYAELFSHIDFCFLGADAELDGYPSAAWIPDFQFLHLPELFSDEECQVRTAWIRDRARHTSLIVLSSRDAEQDFGRLVPDATTQTRILHFHTLPDDGLLQGDPNKVQQKYGMPDRFLLCCNQFWMHKDHATLFRALALLREVGMVVHLACTGSTDDYRNRGYFDELQQLIHELKITDQVQILGHIPRSDQMQLMRRSLCMVQPSLFEGWSTVVEDARALGKTLVLSDIAVHREQEPDYAAYFEKSNAFALAAQLNKLLPLMQPGPHMVRETVAISESLQLAKGFGRCFCSIAREVLQYRTDIMI